MDNVLAADIAAFALLFIASAMLRRRFRHHGYAATAAGGIVMATGIFASFSLPRLPFHSPWLGRLVTIEIMVIWLFLAGSYLASALHRRFRMHVRHPLRRFAIGTWVAGTAVLATLCTEALPEAPLVGRVLALIAVALYLPYALLFVHGYANLLRRALTQDADGVILLATVSTQSVVIALHTAFAGSFPLRLALGMIAFDLVFLCTGLVLIALHYRARRSWLLAVEWKNANCIIHGAVSITGLALVLVAPFQPAVLLDLWFVVLVLFTIVEAIELIRMIERERGRGLRLAIFVYDTTQWARNFTYGMFYAFSFALQRQLDAMPAVPDVAWLPALRGVASWGQYVVLAFLLVEMTLFFRARLHLARR